MSVQVISRVIEHSQHKGSAFVVLLMIANHTHPDGSGAFPNLETLARESRITTRQVSTILGLLERSGELVTERGKGPRGSNLYSIPMQQHPLPLEKISSGRAQQFSSRKPLRKTSTEPSLTVLEENRQAAPDRPSQDTRSEAVSMADDERQFTRQLKEQANREGLQSNGQPSEPLRAELYNGIFRKKISNAFFDLRLRPSAEQLQGCVQEAVTSLVTNRTGKLMVLRAEDIESRTIAKLKLAWTTLQAVQDFSRRSFLATGAIARATADAAAELLEEDPAFIVDVRFARDESQRTGGIADEILRERRAARAVAS